MKSQKLGGLNREEEGRLGVLQAELAQLEQDCAKEDAILRDFQNHQKALETNLSQNFRREVRRLDAELGKLYIESSGDDMEILDDTQKRLKASLDSLEDELLILQERRKDMETTIEDRNSKVEMTRKTEEELKQSVTDSETEYKDHKHKVEYLVKQRNEADAKLRELTGINPDLKAKYENESRAKISKMYQKVNSELNKHDHVNKKAIDQYQSFSEQLVELQTKKKEIDRNETVLRAWIEEIDTQKEETIMRTLDNIRSHFQDIFKELVHDGRGKMEAIKDETEKLTGVKVEVSFTGQTQSFLPMNQLSGGQKTVVALAIIFSIQRMEPAPFYLFDEIDANLDTMYRSAVANLVAKDAEKSQMILTTFRPELLEKASKFYRVYMKNRCSRIDCVTRIEAKRAIMEQTKAEGLDNAEDEMSDDE